MSSQRLDFNDLFHWSLNYQEQYPTDANSSYEPRQLTEEDQKFLLDAMDNRVMDEQKRVKILLQVLRLPSDPTLLYYMERLDPGFKPIQDKDSLRTLLEMRQEDETRKKLGLDIIGAEYIPGNVLMIDEIIKKQLILKTLASYEPLDVVFDRELAKVEAEKGVELDLDERMELKLQLKSTRLSTVTSTVESLLSSHIKSTLSQIPPPTDSDLRKIYNRIREEKLDCFEELEDRTHRGDNAIGFVTFNGLPILKQYLISSDYELASEAWRLLGGIVSNQPLCQQKALEYHLVPLAIECLNLTRYIPHILAAYAFSTRNVDGFAPIGLKEKLQQTKQLQDEQQINHQGHQGILDSILHTTIQSPPLSPQMKPLSLNLGPQQFNDLIHQYNPSLPLHPDGIIDKDVMNWLYNFSHHGQCYVKHIVSLLKSVLFFLISICNNNSSAQTQFVLHHGFLPLSHLFQLSHHYIVTHYPTNNHKNDKNNNDKNTKISPHLKNNKKVVTQKGKIAPFSTPPTPSLPTQTTFPPLSPVAELLSTIFSSSESVFKQTLRRVIQLVTLLVDDEYKVTSSGEICEILFKNALKYHEIYKKTFNFSLNSPGSSILTYIPQPYDQNHGNEKRNSITNQFLNVNNVNIHEQDNNNNNNNFQNNNNNNDDNNNNNNQNNNNPSNTSNNPLNPSNKDEGHTRLYFQDPIAPLRLEDTSEIHPAFKLKSNLTGGVMNKDGVAIEHQFFISPFLSLLIPIFIPTTMWYDFFNCNEWDREVVVGVERMLGLMMKNYYPLENFTTDFSHLSSKKAIELMSSIKSTQLPILDVADASNSHAMVAIEDDDNGVKKDDENSDNNNNNNNTTTTTTTNNKDEKVKKIKGIDNGDEIKSVIQHDFTPQQITEIFAVEFLNNQQSKGKFSSLFHQFVATQGQLIAFGNAFGHQNDHGNNLLDQSSSLSSLQHPQQQQQTTKSINNFDEKLTQTLSKHDAINNTIALLDLHLKYLISQVNIGPPSQQTQRREWNSQESKLIGAIKSGLNQ